MTDQDQATVKRRPAHADASAIDTLCINTIRTLSMDAVQKANSGHPGTPMASRAASRPSASKTSKPSANWIPRHPAIPNTV